MRSDIVLEYDESVIESNPIFTNNKEYINKRGMEQFLKDIGIFIEIVPLYKSPNERGELHLIDYKTDDSEYRLNEKTKDNLFVMRSFEDYNSYQTIKEAGTSMIQKAFELIESNSYFKDWINKLY